MNRIILMILMCDVEGCTNPKIHVRIARKYQKKKRQGKKCRTIEQQERMDLCKNCYDKIKHKL